MKAKIVSIITSIDSKFEEYVCYLAISATAISVFLQVCVRVLFGTALAWCEEIAVYGMAWGVYMGASLCVRERAHIRILLGVRALPKIYGTALLIFGDCLWAAFNLFMVFYGYQYIELLWEQTYISPALEIDQKWPQAIIPLGFALMTFRMVQFYYRWWRSGAQGLPA